MDRVSLPAYDGMLDSNPVQWWYWTCHFDTPDRRRFGCEACFFAFTEETLIGQKLRDDLRRRGWLRELVDKALGRRGFQMVHCALTDVDRNDYRHAPLFALGLPPVEAGRYSLDVSFPPLHKARAQGGGGRDHLQLTLPTWSLDATFTNDDAVSPPALHYAGGCHNYTCGGYTFYYSRPRMSAQGTLTIDGQPIVVSGTAWFDRQLGDLNAVVHQGWQWFAIELADGRNVMLFDILNLRDEAYGAVMKDDEYRVLQKDAFTIDVLDYWTSPHTGIEYPARWRVVMDDERQLFVRPLVADQEFREPEPFETYWEGDCEVTDSLGQAVGRAYVELNGYKRVGP